MKLIRIKQKAAGSRFLLIISLLTTLVALFSRCFEHSPGNDPRGDLYAGAGTCVNCHRDIYSSYTHNVHYRTSAVVDDSSLRQLIGPSRDKDRFYFADSGYIHIEDDQHALSQSSFAGNKRNGSERFDIAFGSAEKAQTYGYWKENRLYQLPLTWFTSLNTWANSPGFPAGHARFDRAIGTRCFECHASYISKELVRSGPLAVSENLDKSSIVYGIDCERCHGPALQHVKFQQENPSVKTAGYIVPIRSLSRQQQLDLCAVCHSGNDQSAQRSLFAFAPGDTLSHFYYPDFGASAGIEPDVHGKQLQLLGLSACFKNSDMTCTTCHDSHGSEENKLAGFISRCVDCHQNSVHAITVMQDNEQRKRDFNLSGQNCIDCHMPLQTSKNIYFNNGAEQKNIPYLIRTHKIAVYKQ